MKKLGAIGTYLTREVDLNSLDPNMLWSRRHIERVEVLWSVIGFSLSFWICGEIGASEISALWCRDGFLQ